MTGSWQIPRLVILVMLLHASHSRADLITFSGAYSNGQDPIPLSYQPILLGYTGDGGSLGITITWNDAWSSNKVVNSQIDDRTNDTARVLMYDGGKTSISMIFSESVTVPSFYYANYTAGQFSIRFQGFTNANDTIAAIDIQRSYDQHPRYTWIEETGFGTNPITKLVFSHTGAAVTGDFLQVDDMTVFSVTAVPEPGTLSMLGVGLLFAAGQTWRRRNTA